MMFLQHYLHANDTSLVQDAPAQNRTHLNRLSSSNPLRTNVVQHTTIQTRLKLAN